ncbi:MAG: primosomal protein N' [Paracoccaceae bacterium]|nr:primosomal protein N' [Paracoccaceae bacterium]
MSAPVSEAFGPGDRVGVALPMPFDEPLDYLVPDGMALGPGDFVEVELGTRRARGVVWGPGGQSVDAARLKPVIARLPVPPLPATMLSFLSRAAEYTMTLPGMMLRLATRVPELGAPPKSQIRVALGPARPQRMTPARKRVIEVIEAHGGLGFAPAELARMAGVTPSVVKGLVGAGALVTEEVPADAPYPTLWGQTLGAHLSEAQAEAATALRANVAAREFSATLLKGVTGSGKTEVYLEAVAECIAQGRQALVLLPEVALTPAFLARVEARFGARPAEWHHGVTGAERRRCWRAVAEGTAQLVVGARSSLFLPFPDLGLIVIDEEHEASFKQEDMVLYHARDMGVLRASIEGATVVLASATPSLESWANADSGKYARIDLPERFGVAVLPDIRLVDLRQEQPGRDRWLSEPFIEAARARIARGEQVLLFLNRRGYAPLTLCRACGHHFGCAHCDAWLVTHRYRAQLMCHQCGHAEPLPRACPNCGRDDRIAACGPGVERLAEEAASLFPGARIEVLSSDLTSGPAELKERLAAIAEGGADVIIGTQMVAKGHNFPLLTLVGVVDADMGLHGGDLRAAERTFQLLRQVAGRAGRADKPGTAMIQTASAEHPVIRAMLTGDEEAFWKAEAEARFQAGVPPYGRMAGVIVSGTDEPKVWEIANALGRAARVLEQAGAELFGPAPAPIARVRGRARVRLLIKAPKGIALQNALAAWKAQVKVPAAVRVVIDIDPQSFL